MYASCTHELAMLLRDGGMLAHEGLLGLVLRLTMLLMHLRLTRMLLIGSIWCPRPSCSSIHRGSGGPVRAEANDCLSSRDKWFKQMLP